MKANSNIEDAQILSEVDLNLIRKLTSAADVLTKGNKGFVVTEGLIKAGYVKDPAKLRAVFNANKKVLNDFAELIDLQKVAETAAEPIQETIDSMIFDKAIPFGVGLALGAGITYLATGGKK